MKAINLFISDKFYAVKILVVEIYTLEKITL
jgi:hypothetical protein